MTTHPTAPLPPTYEESTKQGDGFTAPPLPATYFAGGDYPPTTNIPPTTGYPSAAGYPPAGGYPIAANYPPTTTFAKSPNPAQGYPQQGYPPGNYPQQGYPPGNYPQQGYPAGGYGQAGGYPQSSYASQPRTSPTYNNPSAGGYGDGNYYDRSGRTDGAENFGASFENKNIRRIFVRKVYLTLLLQLLITIGIICLFLFELRVRGFVRRNPWVYYLSFAIFLVVYIVLICCSGVRRRWPVNFIMLMILTLAMSYMMGTISSYYSTTIVLMAMGIAAGTCLAVTIFSIQTKWDFTSCGGVLFVCSVVVLLFGICAIILSQTSAGPILDAVYAGLIGLLFMGYLAYDTQQLIGGRRHEISPEEHIYCSTQLYLDVVYIFLAFLTLLGFSSK